jgi:hypothetical protein
MSETNIRQIVLAPRLEGRPASEAAQGPEPGRLRHPKIPLSLSLRRSPAHRPIPFTSALAEELFIERT